ncbi:complement C1q tumor necrosis factor-related protein 6-like [Mizuhopecten yessoensis]|uniref:complement C1q tumor necrosis factor-related protein 6-like n=1 Tax=Mizuhopecten yessoensis TaxID=6573 RepID=UPI000B45E1F6|nr:complement C1q tumor necrosis factor-related protein 6-like [Mizuhopecten yessoensis]
MRISVVSIAVILLAVIHVNGDYPPFPTFRPYTPSPPVEEDDEDAACALKVKCSHRKGLPGLDGQNGLPGLDGLPGFTGEDGFKGEKGERGLSVERAGSSVVFFSALDENMGPLNGETLLYKHVPVNIGSAYDPNTGMFTAPSSGIYLFNIVVAAQPEKTAAVQLRKIVDNTDKHVVVVWAESLPNWGTSSNSVYLSLDQGQQLFLIARQNLNSYYNASMSTTFSGHLVTPAL